MDGNWCIISLNILIRTPLSVQTEDLLPQNHILDIGTAFGSRQKLQLHFQLRQAQHYLIPLPFAETFHFFIAI